MEQSEAALRQEFARLHQRLDALERKIDALTGTPTSSAAPTGTPVPGAPSLSVPEGVLQLLQAGHIDQAIDAYQQLSGVDARTAQAVVAGLVNSGAGTGPRS